MEKEEVYIDEKIGEKIEEPQLNLEEEDDSPIEEVRVTVPSMYFISPFHFVFCSNCFFLAHMHRTSAFLA